MTVMVRSGVAFVPVLFTRLELKGPAHFWSVKKEVERSSLIVKGKQSESDCCQPWPRQGLGEQTF